MLSLLLLNQYISFIILIHAFFLERLPSKNTKTSNATNNKIPPII